MSTTGSPCMVGRSVHSVSLQCLRNTDDELQTLLYFKLILMTFCVIFLLSVVDFFNRINVIYGVVCEFCSEESCPTMSGGPK